jgi:hypothetical protein
MTVILRETAGGRDVFAQMFWCLATWLYSGVCWRLSEPEDLLSNGELARTVGDFVW